MTKATVNNYTQAAPGTPSIESMCCYDRDAAQWEFKENFEILQHGGYRTHTIAYYIDNGNVKDSSEISFELRDDEPHLEQVLQAQGYDDAEDALEILETLYGEHITLLNFEDFNKTMNVNVQPSKQLERLSIRGYHQGDYAQVWFCRDDLHKAWGRIPRDGELRGIFERLFYDAPIYAQVTIDGIEYVYWDCPACDSYEWHRDEFIAWVAKESGVSAELLESIVQKEPSYD